MTPDPTIAKKKNKKKTPNHYYAGRVEESNPGSPDGKWRLNPLHHVCLCCDEKLVEPIVHTGI